MAEFCHKNRDIDFAALVRAHNGHVRSALRRRGVRGADVDDLSQQVWLVAFTHYDEILASPGTVRRWLSEVARRRALDLHGSSWICRNVCIEAEDLAGLASESGSKIEAAAILSKMLSRLAERDRELVRLRALQWEMHEIAEFQGAAWTTVQSRWQRACAELAGA